MLVDRCVDTLTRVSKNSKFVILMRNNFIYAFNFKRDSFRRQRNIFELLFQYTIRQFYRSVVYFHPSRGSALPNSFCESVACNEPRYE